MPAEYFIEDIELGRLVVRVNSRARNFVFRTKLDAIYVSVPPGTTTKEVHKAIDDLRSKLKICRKKQSHPKIDLDYKIDADFFKMVLISGEGDRFLANSKLGMTQVICPLGADFSDENLQEWLRKVIEEALRKNAKIILP